MGIDMGVKGLAIMLLGGLGNIYGAMVGGLLLGVVEVLSVAYLASSYRDAFAFGVMIADPALPAAGPLRRRRVHVEARGVLDPYGESVLIFLGINMVLALSLYLPISAGQLSLGHGGFMAIGAYVTVICTTWLGWPLVAWARGAAAWPRRSPAPWSASPPCASRGSTSSS